MRSHCVSAPGVPEQVEPFAAARGEPRPQPGRSLEGPPNGLDAVEDPGEADEGSTSLLHGDCSVTEEDFNR